MVNPISMGFVMPSGDDYLREGDNAISKNAQAAADAIVKAQKDATADAIAGAGSYTDQAVSLAAGETRSYTDQAVSLAAGETRSYTDQAVSLDRSRLVDLEQVAPKVSNFALDTDGTPYFSEGSTSVHIILDTDGTPYYTTFATAARSADGTISISY